MSEPTRTCPPESAEELRATLPADGTTPSEAALAAPSGYELHSELGRGGMGVVYRARDVALARDVAVKILHDRFAPDSASARRFVDEAQITGQLQHPGIPAVHQAGALPDGRPFLAMKLIKGHTLEAELEARTDPTVDRGRFVGVFEQICQAVAYAHAHKVIHRDLKPGNVMVGDYGEVQVMDWGLAKIVGEGASSAEPNAADETRGTEIRSLRDAGELTQAGSLLGTPAFMPPEQAIGAVNQVDARSDVFGLGAILCVILTGKPPYVGADAESTRLLAARGKLDDVIGRLDACGAEPELLALCKRCLSAEPADRPKDAGEVAAAVAHLRADAELRARQAELSRARAEVKAAEERKRRRVQRALAVTVLALVAVAGFAVWWTDRVKEQREAERKAEQLRTVEAAHARVEAVKAQQRVTEIDVTAALNEARALREAGRKQIDDTHRWGLTLTTARSALKHAEGLLASGVPTDELRARVATATAELDHDDRDRALIVELDRISDENDIRFLIPVSISGRPAERYAAAFRAHGFDPLEVPLDEAIARLKGQPEYLRARLIAALRNWQLSYPSLDFDSIPGLVHSLPGPALAAVAGEAGYAAVQHRPTPRRRLSAVLSAVTGDPFIREWWTALEAENIAGLKALLKRPELRRMSPREMACLADGLVHGPGLGLENMEFLTEFLQTAYELFPGEYWVNFALATAARPAGKTAKDDEARVLRHLTAAVAARPGSTIARVALGSAIWEQRKEDSTGPRMLRTAAELDPTSPWPHFMLGLIAVEKENFADALNSFERAIRADPDLGFMMITPFLTLFPFLNEQSTFPKPELAACADRLVAQHPDHPGAYNLRGELRLKMEDARGALADFRKGQTLTRPNYWRSLFVDEDSVPRLESLARWEGKLPAVLRGETKPATADEFAELAGYCAKFEQNYALAARFAGEALAADPKLFTHAEKVAEFAGWSVRASREKAGADAPTPEEQARLRRQGLAWLRKAVDDIPKPGSVLLRHRARTNAHLKSLQTPTELSRLPPAERAAWEKLWSDLRATDAREEAPPPRHVMPQPQSPSARN